MALEPPLTLPHAVLLDMDGTLTEPMLDFERIRAEIGAQRGQPILEALAAMDETSRGAAQAVLDRHEEHAAENSTLHRGCRELLDWLHAHSIPIALITRNSRRSARTVLDRHQLRIDVLVSREDGKFKPDPEPLFTACRKIHVQPHQTWMVGDGQYDVEAGLAAGARTVWLSLGRTRPFRAEPWQTVNDLPELLELLRRCAGEVG